MIRIILLSFLISSCRSNTYPEWVADATTKDLQAFLQERKQEFVFIEGGSFLMGDTVPADSMEWGKTPMWNGKLKVDTNYGPVKTWFSGTDGAHFVHKVELSSYSMAKYETTWLDYDFYHKFTQQKSAYKIDLLEYPDTKKTRLPNFPVGYISWEQATAYCKWLGEQLQLPIDLPTEAQWEYAARSRGVNLPFATNTGYGDIGINMGGKHPADTCPRCKSPRTYSKDHFPPNKLGLYAMSGNRHEWVKDWFDKDYYKVSPLKDPQGPKNGTRHLTRGGGEDQTRMYNSVFGRYERYTTAEMTDDEYDFGYGVTTGFRCSIQPDNK